MTTTGAAPDDTATSPTSNPLGSPALQQQERVHEAPADEDLLTVLPWDVVGSFLRLRDVLSLRLASSHIATSLHDNLGDDLCSTWLQNELVRRNVYVFNDIRQWKHARREEAAPGVRRRSDDDDNDDVDEHCLLRWLLLGSMCPSHTTPHSTNDDSLKRDISPLPPKQQHEVLPPSPFSLLLRCLRVIRYLPYQLTVAYSGKYGRHCWGLSGSNDDDGKEHRVVRYPDCHRGTKKGSCATCRTRIETVLATNDFEEDRSAHGLTVDMTLRIPVVVTKKKRRRRNDDNNNSAPATASSNPHGDKDEDDNSESRCVRLDNYHNKCIPNVPSDLVCPICRVTHRRTLVLTELSYQTEPGTERVSNHRRSHHLTFTPALDDGGVEDDSPLRGKRRRSHEDEGEGGGTARANAASVIVPFPPSYRESFLYNFYEENVDMDVKHAVSLHCDHCQQFGVLSPAHRYPLDERGQCLQERMRALDPSFHHVMFSSAFLQRCRPRPQR